MVKNHVIEESTIFTKLNIRLKYLIEFDNFLKRKAFVKV